MTLWTDVPCPKSAWTTLSLVSLLGFLAVAMPMNCAYAALESTDFTMRAAQAFDDTITFLQTISIGLFAAAGLFLRDGLKTNGRERCLQVLCLVIFVLANSISLLCCYLARGDLVTVLASGSFGVEGLAEYYKTQAIMVLIAGVSLLIFIGFSLKR